jgi:hypothetical protein
MLTTDHLLWLIVALLLLLIAASLVSFLRLQRVLPFVATMMRQGLFDRYGWSRPLYGWGHPLYRTLVELIETAERETGVALTPRAVQFSMSAEEI